MTRDIPSPVMIAGLGLAAVAVLLIFRDAAGQVARATTGAAVDLVDNVVSGAVVGVGEGVGVPATNIDQCAADKAAGRTWDASFSCPAKDFLGWWWSK